MTLDSHEQLWSPLAPGRWGGGGREAAMPVLWATCHCSMPGIMLDSQQVLKTELWNEDMRGGLMEGCGHQRGIIAWGLWIHMCQRRATVA